MFYDYTFKILLAGNSHSGKTSLLSRFTSHTFPSTHTPTLGVDFGLKPITLSNINIRLQIWDTAGLESWPTLTRTYYKNTAGVIIVYDISDRESFENLEGWVEQVERNRSYVMPIMIIGNKLDMKVNREVTVEEGRAYANSKGMVFMETSAKLDTNVEKVFEVIAWLVYEQVQEGFDDNLGMAAHGVMLNSMKKS